MSKILKVLGIVLLILILCIGVKFGIDSTKIKVPDSGDNAELIEEAVSKIDEYVRTIKQNLENDINIERVETNVTEEEIGNVANEFMEAFQTDELTATAIVHKNDMVIIIPTIDFIDTQYYYYKDGKLLMYTREFAGVGGNADYYFDNDKIIKVKENIEEGMVFVKETASDILALANNNYEKYTKSDL